MKTPSSQQETPIIQKFIDICKPTTSNENFLFIHNPYILAECEELFTCKYQIKDLFFSLILDNDNDFFLFFILASSMSKLKMFFWSTSICGGF
jgi:hypothetical protein